MLATLQRQNTRQPQQIRPVSRGNPLAAGLSLLQVLGPNAQYDSVRGVNSAVVGTKSVTYPGGIATGFAAAFGAGTTDRIATPLVGAFTGRSYHFRAMRNGAGGNSLGRLADKTNGAAGQLLYVNHATGNVVSSVYFGGAEVIHTTPAPALGTWFDLVVTCLTTATTVTTTFYINGVLVGSTSTTPAGAFNDAAATVLSIGNRADGIRGWDGLIAIAAVWERILSPGEAVGVMANPWQLLSPGPTSYSIPEASASTNTQISPSVGSLAITGQAPTVSQTAHQTIAPSAGSLTITGQAPTVAQSANQATAPVVGSISITGYAPSVTQGPLSTTPNSYGSTTMSASSAYGQDNITATNYGATLMRATPVYSASVMISTTYQTANL